MPKGERITVTARREGFRRAGRVWSASPTTLVVAELTEAELAAIEAEPMLTVERAKASTSHPTVEKPGDGGGGAPPPPEGSETGKTPVTQRQASNGEGASASSPEEAAATGTQDPPAAGPDSPGVTAPPAAAPEDEGGHGAPPSEGATHADDASQAGRGADQRGGAGAPPRTPAEARVEAIGRLNPKNRRHFTAGGVPRVDALAKEAGVDTTSADRDAAWAKYQEGA